MQKNLGQHFLVSPTAILALVSALGATKKDTVVEIGSGTGEVTLPLLKCAKQVIAIEKDRVLAEKLHKSAKNPRLKVVHDDIRNFNPATLGLIDYLVIGNIPYYITGTILRIILSSNPPPERAVFVTQREVAERICVPRGKQTKESILSIAVKVYGTARYIKTIRRGAFKPPPRVDSAIISIEDVSHNFFNNLDEKEFFELVRKGFSHKRKLLKNNLDVPKKLFEACNISENARAEDLAIADWRCLVSRCRD